MSINWQLKSELDSRDDHVLQWSNKRSVGSPCEEIAVSIAYGVYNHSHVPPSAPVWEQVMEDVNAVWPELEVIRTLDKNNWIEWMNIYLDLFYDCTYRLELLITDNEGLGSLEFIRCEIGGPLMIQAYNLIREVKEKLRYYTDLAKHPKKPQREDKAEKTSYDLYSRLDSCHLITLVGEPKERVKRAQQWMENHGLIDTNGSWTGGDSKAKVYAVLHYLAENEVILWPRRKTSKELKQIVEALWSDLKMSQSTARHYGITAPISAPTIYSDALQSLRQSA